MKGIPISPDELMQSNRPEIPEYVFAIFNELIKQEWDGKKATITLETVIKRIMAVNDKIIRSEIISNKLLEVDEFYREKGWKVEYIKPSYHDFVDHYWVFSKMNLKIVH